KDSTGELTASLIFYESGRDVTQVKRRLEAFFDEAHPEDFTDVEKYWAPSQGGLPFVGKSRTGRAPTEPNAPPPIGVSDLTVHPPDGDGYVVVTFEAPARGDYSVAGLGIRRVSQDGGDVELRVYDSEGKALSGV